jgi:hypothetical protein
VACSNENTEERRPPHRPTSQTVTYPDDWGGAHGVGEHRSLISLNSLSLSPFQSQEQHDSRYFRSSIARSVACFFLRIIIVIILTKNQGHQKIIDGVK